VSVATNPLCVPARDGRPSLDLGRDVHALLGLVFDAVTLKQAALKARQAAAEARPCFFSTPNVNFAVAARTDAEFRDSVLRSDLSLADGAPVVWLARMLGVPLPERVAGSDLFEHLRRFRSSVPNPAPAMTVFFFGGPDGVAQRAGDVLNAEAKWLRCVGALSPGFGSVEEMSRDEVIDRINDSGADFAVIALGAKKGQAWIERNRHRLKAPLVCHLGAVVNFVAGEYARAPGWMRRIGLEWLWRTKEEPKLWRRYTSDGRAFLHAAVAAMVSRVRLWWLTRARHGHAAEPHFDVKTDTQASTIVLRGTWIASTLIPLRRELAARLTAGESVQFDLTEATRIDSALLGLIAIVDRWQVEPRAIASTSRPSPAVLAAIDAFDTRWLLPCLQGQHVASKDIPA
jgi:N-acetylglucosaminyldiphosphoundecaprenol N-acetyl-beta-D-mannosaminyltransferase